MVDDERLTAAVGFASQVMFFGLSVNIGITIAVAALVSRALGAGERSGAQRLAASGLVQAGAIAGGLVVAGYPFRADCCICLAHAMGRWRLRAVC